MNEIDEILDLINSLENMEWNLLDNKFDMNLSNLLNLLDIELTDIKISMEELKNETIKLRVALEEIEFDKYINTIVEDLIDDFRQDVTGISIKLTNVQARNLILKELFKNEK